MSRHELSHGVGDSNTIYDGQNWLTRWSNRTTIFFVWQISSLLTSLIHGRAKELEMSLDAHLKILCGCRWPWCEYRLASYARSGIQISGDWRLSLLGVQCSYLLEWEGGDCSTASTYPRAQVGQIQPIPSIKWGRLRSFSCTRDTSESNPFSIVNDNILPRLVVPVKILIGPWTILVTHSEGKAQSRNGRMWKKIALLFVSSYNPLEDSPWEWVASVGSKPRYRIGGSQAWIWWRSNTARCFCWRGQAILCSSSKWVKLDPKSVFILCLISFHSCNI